MKDLLGNTLHLGDLVVTYIEDENRVNLVLGKIEEIYPSDPLWGTTCRLQLINDAYGNHDVDASTVILYSTKHRDTPITYLNELFPYPGLTDAGLPS